MRKFLTSEIAGTGGAIKEAPEDFQVGEIPLYAPSGEGEHTFIEIEKRGVTTLEAVRRISRAVGVAERDIGYAGMKDARGITRQTLSVPRTPPESLLSLELPGIRVLSAVRHRNKLKPGHLAGNRFLVRVRDVAEESAEVAARVLEILDRRGVPNYFGPQRYGAMGNSHRVGAAVIRGDFRQAVDALIGDPDQVRDEGWRNAIDAYRNGNLEGALSLFPAACRNEREILQRLLKRPDGWEKAFRAVNPRMQQLYLSAFQSELFDRLLEMRVEELDRVVLGDVAWKHENGACFLVEDAALEAQRAQRLEISATGPIFGCRMKMPQGMPLAMEESLLREEGLTTADFDLPGRHRLEGERRPLRVQLGKFDLRQDGEGLLLEFSLPKGVYATSVLREITKGW